jgi:hypothetical protein
LIEDLVTLGASAESSVSYTEGLSEITACGEGAAMASGCGSSSSLQIGNKFYTTQKKEIEKDNETCGNTYEAIRSKNSTPSSWKGASVATIFLRRSTQGCQIINAFPFLVCTSVFR